MKKIIEIKADKKGIFKERLNKFLGIVDIGYETMAHIHDSGRLIKILYSGNEILLKKADGKRKTKWDILAGKYKNKWVFSNSFYHSMIAKKIIKIIFGEIKIEKEIKYKNSRIDFLLNGKMFLEVKGCTLEKNGMALFPDAPTLRGRKHLKALIDAAENGYDAAILFLIFVPSQCFMPNEKIDKSFSSIFREGVKKGIKIYPALLEYDGNKIFYKIKRCCRYAKLINRQSNLNCAGVAEPGQRRRLEGPVP